MWSTSFVGFCEIVSIHVKDMVYQFTNIVKSLQEVNSTQVAYTISSSVPCFFLINTCNC